MGLDQYAYLAHSANAKAKWYEGSVWDNDLQDFVNPDPTAEKPVELAYWRKHPNLQGWMEQLYFNRGGDNEFNGAELELTLDDLVDLELAIKTKNLPPTSGFFFGVGADDLYYKQDLEFIAKARQAIADSYQVFYNSSW